MIDDLSLHINNHDTAFTGFSAIKASLTGADKEVIDDSQCGGRGCCDDQVAAAENVAKPLNMSQLIPEIAAISFALGMCCVWVAGRKRKAKKTAPKKDDSDDSD